MEKANSVSTPDWSWDIQNLRRRADDADRKFRILMDLLVAKKILDEPTVKIFQETNTDDIVKWFEEKYNTKTQ